MKDRLPLILSVTALVVSILGATPLGRAAERAVRSIPPLASRSNYAKVAANALHLSGHAASLSGSPGTIPVLNKSGKLPTSVGAVGAQGMPGPPGPTGPAGPAGPAAQVDLSKLLSNNVDVVATSLVMNGTVDTESVMCPAAGWVAVGGGVYTADGSVVTSGSWPFISGRGLDGPPDSDSGPPTGWVTRVATPTSTPANNVLVRWFAVCVKAGS